ncbi:MAG: hypothetical protein H8D67_29970 [Deltaproteobacteria bacterium]|nr:hypothetical protein [Deltaproteobacteria bacterium]
MDREEVTTALKRRLTRLQPYNLVYVVLPLEYNFLSVAEEIASEINAEYISVIGLLLERFGNVWDRLIERERQGELSAVATALRDLIQKEIQNSNNPIVIADVEVLSIMPEMDLTSLLYLFSNMKLICAFIRGEFTGNSIRLLGASPEYDVRQCTVLNLTEQ